MLNTITATKISPPATITTGALKTSATSALIQLAIAILPPM